MKKQKRKTDKTPSALKNELNDLRPIYFLFLTFAGIVNGDPWVGKIPWRRERLPTPVFWPREFHGLYSPWGHNDSDMTEQLSLSL